jgi:hypothetical protein
VSKQYFAVVMVLDGDRPRMVGMSYHPEVAMMIRERFAKQIPEALVEVQPPAEQEVFL